MGKVFFKDPIEYISGKIAKKFNTIYNHRVKATTSKFPNFTSVRGERTTAVSATETTKRFRFGQIGKNTQLRLKNATKRAQDETAFKAQATYSTLYQYVWHQVANEYDLAQQNAG